MAVQAHPESEQRVNEAIALLPNGHEVDILQPGQIVLGRPGRAIQPVGNLGQRQRFLLREHVQDRLQGAIAAGAVQPQLVAEPAHGRQLGAGR